MIILWLIGIVIIPIVTLLIHILKIFKDAIIGLVESVIDLLDLPLICFKEIKYNAYLLWISLTGKTYYDNDEYIKAIKEYKGEDERI